MRASLACCVILLVGCGGPGGGTDIDPTLVFADRSDAQLVRLMNAGAGSEIFLAELQLNQFGDVSDADPCPAISIEGNVATITGGGCTTAAGTTIEGSAVVTNPIGWDQIEDYRFGSDTLYEADAFSTSSGGQPPVIIDGYIRRTNSLQTYETDFTFTQLDVGVRSDLVLACTTAAGNVSCTISGGIELIGVGGAVVSGTIETVGGAQTLDITLQGADRLLMHREGSCFGWSIEGTERGMPCP